MDTLETGQVWVAAAKDDAPPLLCVIGRIDEFRNARQHLKIISVQLAPHPDARDKGWPVVGHMPILEADFHRSGMKLAKSGVDCDEGFHEGYKEWRKAFETGEAGAFSVTVSEAYNGIVSLATRPEGEPDPTFA